MEDVLNTAAAAVRGGVQAAAQAADVLGSHISAGLTEHVGLGGLQLLQLLGSTVAVLALSQWVQVRGHRNTRKAARK
jgi:hypothetical protein